MYLLRVCVENFLNKSLNFSFFFCFKGKHGGSGYGGSSYGGSSYHGSSGSSISPGILAAVSGSKHSSHGYGGYSGRSHGGVDTATIISAALSGKQ